LEKGDIILELNGKPVEDANQLRMSISMMSPDTAVNLKVFRNGAERDFTVKLAELPTQEARVRDDANGAKNELSGISVQDLDAQTARRLDIPAATAGVVVTDISPSSPAVDSGLQRGDVIQEVNRHPVRNTADFEAAMRNSKDSTLLLVNRRGNTMYVAV
jgi:serine protease Do